MTKIRQMIFALVSISSLVITGTTTALAQAYPTRTIRLQVGYGPGGTTDILARALADGLTKELGQPVVVENRSGASGLVAAKYVKAATPDGYTLFVGPAAAFAPLFMKDGLDVTTELAPVTMLTSGDWFVFVPTSLNVATLKDFIAYAKANPDKARAASIATSSTLMTAIITKQTGAPIEDIRYRTSDQVVISLLRGDTQISFNGASGYLPHVESGKLKAIATLSPRRSDILPEVATATEQGFPLTNQFTGGLWAPPGTPAGIVARLNSAVAIVMKDPEVIQRVKSQGLSPTTSSPEEQIADQKGQLAFYTEGAKLMNYQPE